MSDGAGMQAWSYDSLGRVLTDRRTTNSVIKDFAYLYNKDGSLASVTYPSGRKVNNGLSAAARLTSVNFDSFGGTPVNYNYLSAASYAPHGAPVSLTLGNGLTETMGYSNRLQPSQMRVASGILTASDFLYNFVDGQGHNNGNVMRIADQLNASRSQNFTYDQLNRLDCPLPY